MDMSLAATFGAAPVPLPPSGWHGQVADPRPRWGRGALRPPPASPCPTRQAALAQFGPAATHRRRHVAQRTRADSPDLVIAQRLLDHLKLRGFQFQRAAPGVDGPLVGSRVSGEWVDLTHIEGFSRDCFAWRKRTSSLIVPGDGLVEHRVHGHALTVLNTVLTWEAGPPSRSERT